MTSCKKRKGFNGSEVIFGTAMSSYAPLNVKLKKWKEQCQQLLNELVETKYEKDFVNAELVKVRIAFLESQRQQTKSDSHLELLRKQLEEDKMKSDDLIKVLKDDNAKLTKRVGLFHQQMEKLQSIIAASSDAYDAMVVKVEQLEETKQQPEPDLKAAAKLRSTRHAVCRAFGWCHETADHILFRAACAFWDGCTITEGDDTDRISLKTRKDIWLELTV
jgi:hypothetical protein